MYHYIDSLIKIIYNIFEDVNLIHPRLWLGNINISQNRDFIINNDIDVIVNCTPNIPYLELNNHDCNNINKELIKIRIPVEDSLLEKDIILMEEYLKEVIPKLIEYHAQNKNILIHCYAGKQRSAIVVATLLFKIFTKDHTTLSNTEVSEKVFSIILSNRPQAFTFGYRINFLKSFNRYLHLN
jgi:protein-tyrosine phosphatase